jgi:hypothetical protein
MNLKTFKWLIFIFLTLLSASLACGIESLPAYRATEQVNPKLGFCGDDLVLSNEFIITCNNREDSVLNSFNGSYFNNSDNYIESVDFIISFRKYGTDLYAYCRNLVGVNIPPGKTEQIACTFTTEQCFQDATVSAYADECDYDFNKTFGFKPVEELEESQPVEEQVEEPTEEIEDQPTIEEIFNAVNPDINKIRIEWPIILKQHPCEPDVAMQAISNWVDENIQGWIAGPIQLVGPDQSWETIKEYKEWLIANVLDENREKVFYFFRGELNMTNAPTKACQTCAPPSFESWINFKVDLETCAITGEVRGRGAGDGVKSECENDENECNVYGDISFNGEITGSVDISGNLTLDPVSISSKWRATYEGCKNKSDGSDSGTGSGTINLTGTINWETKFAEGEGELSGGSCAPTGIWECYGSDLP